MSRKQRYLLLFSVVVLVLFIYLFVTYPKSPEFISHLESLDGHESCELVLKEKLTYPPVLFLTNELFRTGTDRHFFQEADAYINASNGKSFVWGFGFDDYEASLTLRDNIIKRFGSVKYFAAVSIYILKCTHEDEKEIRDISNETIVILKNHECFGDCASVIPVFGIKIYMLSYAKELAALAFSEKVNVDMLVHSPLTAPTFMYAEVEDKIRVCRAVLIGTHDYFHYYPMRDRFYKLIRRGRIRGAVVLKHPGYLIDNVEAHRLEYVKSLQKHKAVLFCSTVIKYQIRKFAETAIAGALIIATLPDDDPDFWAENIVAVNLDMSDRELIEIIEYWLNHDSERIVKAKKAQKAVMLKYTTTLSAQIYAKSIALHLSGFRGSQHYFPFVNSCAGSSPWIPTNKWCLGEEVMERDSTLSS